MIKLFLLLALMFTPDQLRDNLRLFNHHPKQLAFERSRKNVQVVMAGRRAGKTKIKKRKIVKAALGEYNWPDWRGFLGAPTRQQAKDLFWEDLKKMIPRKCIIGDPLETELKLRLYNGAEIHVEGLDRMDRIEGQPWNYMDIDEVDGTKKGQIEEHIFPMMTDRNACLVLGGVPDGKKELNRYYQMALDPDMVDWGAYDWTSEEVLPLYLGKEEAAKQIAAARKRMDPLLFAQEYEAKVVSFQGRIYYQFDENVHAIERLAYYPEFDLIFVFDFNVSPGVAGIGQEIPDDDDPMITQTHILGEVYIPKNSTTPSVCRKLIADWGKHRGNVFCYGDSTGGNKGSAKIAGSDWDIIEDMLRPVFKNRLEINVKSRNPSPRTRINATNARFESADGTISALVDPRVKHTAEDFDAVTVLEGSDGEIDKKKDLSKTHISDAWGYYFDYEFPYGEGELWVSSDL